MKKLRHLSALMSISLLFIVVGCFGPKQSSSSKEAKERMEQRERAERKKHKNSRIPEKARRIQGADEENEEEENDKYDGVQAAQQREYDLTHDPATNTLPKDRLFSALQKRDALIELQKAQGRFTQGTGSGTNGIPLFPATGINWLERGSYADLVGPSNGNGRDSNAVTSGRITAFLADLDPTKPNQVFIGGIDGGLWSCPDITVSRPQWTFIDNFANLGISSITQDPTNTNIMYFGTGEKSINADAVLGGGVYKSTDHGASWTLMSNTVDFKQVSKVICDKNGYVYVGTNFKSTTIGLSSRGLGFNVGLVRSKDGGTTWENITPTVSGLTTPRVSDMVYDPSNDRMHVYMGYYPSTDTIKTGFCYGTPSTVASNTWSTPTSAATGLGMFISTTPTATFLYQTVLAVKNGVVWALRSNYNNSTGATSMPLYRSLDGGATWTLQSTQTDGSGQGWYSIALDCDPQNPANNVIFASLNVLKSTNGGTSFTQVARWVNSGASNQYVHADGHYVYYNTNAAGQNRAIVCSDGGVFYSNNGGANWADRNVGLRIKQFYSCAISPSVPDYYLAGAQDNGSHQFTQPGLGVSTEVTGGDGCIVAIDQLNPKNQVASYVYNQYRISTDGGATWVSANLSTTAGLFVNPFDVDSKTKKLYGSYTAGTYVRWDDPFTTRNTFTAVPISSVIGNNVATAVTVSTNLNNTIYVAASTSAATPFVTKVAKVVNANTNTPTVTDITPAAVTSGSVISSIVLGPSATDQDIILTSSSFGAKKVFVTADGGTSWTEITGNLPDLPVRWSMYYPGSSTQILLATEAGIWLNTNGVSNGSATNWMPSVGFPAVRSDMIKYSPSMGLLAVGTHGRGLWTAKISTNPKISFYNGAMQIAKNLGSSIIDCRTYQDYSDTLIISEAPTGAATVTLTTLPGGTATEGVDFDYTTNGSFTAPSKVATFSNATYPNEIPVLIRVYNNHDKNAAQPETATIGFTVSGSTDAVAAAANQTVTLSLTDILPSSTTLTAQTLWTENWETAGDGYANWTFSPDAYHASLPNTTAFVPYFSNCNSNINAVTAQLVTTDASGNLSLCANGNGGTAFTARMYRAVNAANNRYTGMSVRFSYRSGGSATMTNSLVYSTNNGSTWTILASYAARTTTATVTVTLPAALNNTNFLLGWQTVATAAAVTNTYGFGVDDITVLGSVAPSPIDSIAGSTSTDYVAVGQSIDFYSANNNIIANISNPSQTLACTVATLENVGNTWQSFAGGTRSQKTFNVVPAQNGATTTYNATFYFNNAELAGKTIGSLRIAKTSANSIAEANNSNTIFVTPITTTTYNVNGVATGVGFSGAFTGFSRFFLVDANATVPIAFTNCPTTSLAIARPGYNVYNNEPTSMYTVDTTTGAATLISGGPLKDFTSNKNIEVNGAGINSQDGFVYAIRDTINAGGTAAAAMFYRIGSNYSNYMLGNLPAPAVTGNENLAVVNPAAGGFDDQGNYYYIGMAGVYINNGFTPSSFYIGKLSNVAALSAGTGTLTPTWTKIDFSNVACGTFKTSLSGTITSASGSGAGTSFQDITYSNVYRSLYVYAAYQSAGNYMGQLLSINPATGVASCSTPTSNFGAANNEVAGISTTANGSLLVFMTGGDIYKSTIAANGTYTGAMAKIGASGIAPLGVMGSMRGDLASCGFGPTTLPVQPSSIVVGAPNQIVAYPNPANGITTITVSQPLNKANIKLVGVSGNVISERSGVSGYTFQMDMTGKPSGLYIVEVIQGGNIIKAKIIKE